MPTLHVSAQAADSIYNLSNISIVFGATLALIGAIGVFWSGGIRDRYADERASGNETKTALATQEAARANESAAGANLRAAEVERQNIDLRRKFANRRIDAEQHAALVAELSKHPRIFDMQVMGDTESGLYAADILKTFTDAGWTVDKKEFPLGVIWTGLTLFMTNDPALPDVAAAFNQARVPFVYGDQTTERVTIMVGGKPPVF